MARFSNGVTQPRRYRGVTPEERQKRRREQLLDAGLELFGTVGYGHTSVRAICQEASLNQRYFYESFDSREDLLEAVYLRVIAELNQTALLAAMEAEGLEQKARAGLSAWWSVITGDARKARIVGVELVGASERLKTLQRNARSAMAEFLIAEYTVATGSRDLAGARLDPVLTARSLVGAIVELLMGYMGGEIDKSIDEIVEHCIGLFTATARMAGKPA